MSINNQILHGDCLSSFLHIADDSVDLIVTSPPYADKRTNVYGSIKADQYVEWFIPRAKEFYRVLKTTGSFVLNIKEAAVDGVRQTHVVNLHLALMANGWRWVEEYIWVKTNPFPTGSERRLKDGFERIFHFTKTKDFLFFPNLMKVKSISPWIEANRKRKNKGAFSTTNRSGLVMNSRITDDMVRPSTVLTFPSSCINIDHPAVFPRDLPAFFIKLMTKPGGLVIDPFNGSGTSTLAAQELGRDFIGMDTQPEYCELARKRLQEEMQSRTGSPGASN